MGDGMSVQERIAEVLGQHIYYGMGECRCGWGRNDENPAPIEAFLSHQAAVIAALPDIAIIEYPKTTDLADYTDESNPVAYLGWEVGHGPYFVSVYDPGEVQISYDGSADEPISSDYAHDLGAALIAAAHSAGGAK